MSTARQYTQDDLVQFKPRFKTFVGIDSDGCVFPTMEIKQKQCFHSLILSTWELGPIEKAVRQVAEFVNLYSIYRGQNRFLSMLRTFELLPGHPGARHAGVTLPPAGPLRAFCESGLPLSNSSLESLVAKSHDPELQKLLDWSLAVNQSVARNVKAIKPFRWALESLEDIRQNSDAICVSQTPTEALVREWKEHNILDYVGVIAGQELGTKSEHLTLATQGRYPADRVLMIGDAPGDMKAAHAVGAHFFPINPNHEEQSWEHFHTEAYGRFLEGRFDAAYEARLTGDFMALLPETPPWLAPGAAL